MGIIYYTKNERKNMKDIFDTSKGTTYDFILQRKTGKNKSLKKGNQVLNSNDRMHPIVKNQITGYLRQLANDEVLKHTKKSPYNKHNPCYVIVTIHPPTKRRIDAPNFYPTIKALIDGMTDAGLWIDDNNQIIKFMTFILGEKTENKKYKFSISICPYNK